MATNSERVKAKRAQRDAEKQTIKALKTLVNGITDIVGLDEERIGKRIDSAMQSEYGRVNGMVNLVSALAHWPAEAGDGSAVSENRKLLESKLNLDLLTLADIRTFRGFHTFHTEDLETIDGQAPSYEDYEDYVAMFLEDLDLTPQRITIDSATWERQEAKAKRQTVEKIEALRLAVEKHKEFIASAGE